MQLQIIEDTEMFATLSQTLTAKFGKGYTRPAEFAIRQ